MRLKPIPESPAIATLVKGTVLNSYGEEGAWFRLVLPPGKDDSVLLLCPLKPVSQPQRHRRSVCQDGKSPLEKIRSLDFALSFALVLLSKGDPGKARAMLLPFGDKEVSSFELYRNLGKASQGTGNPKEAISWYEKALAFRGSIVEVLNSLGECYLKSGDKAKALRAW